MWFLSRVMLCRRSIVGTGSRQSAIKFAPIHQQYRPQPKVSRIKTVTEPEPWSIPKRRLAQLGGVVIFLASLFATHSYVRGPIEQPSASQIPLDVSDRYNKIAKKFDSEVGFVEAFSGYGWLRSWICREASGNVLEVSVGTGRNSKYFDLKECKSITFIDQSQEMVEIAEEKFRKNNPDYRACRFVTQSALDPIISPPGGFDTILQTMGICSIADPVRLLRHLGSLVNADHGRILLLEHGQGHFQKLNSWLDESAPAHADRYGCWWNKDIGSIVAESGLEVVTMKRYHFGTTWWVELRPSKSQRTTSPRI